MEIVAYQIKDDLECRFIYKTKHGFNVVSAENHHGLKDFLRNYGGKQLDNTVNIYDHSVLLKLRAPIIAKM